MVRILIKTSLAYLLVFNVLALFWVFLYSFMDIPVTKRMVIEKQTQPVDYRWMPLEEISGQLQLAVMCSEDGG